MNAQNEQDLGPARDPGKGRKVLTAAAVSQSIEFYDFMIYGTAASLVFGSHFFPAYNAAVGVMASFGTFAVGFAARPVGGVVFGHIGDKYGRKPALVGCLLLMAVASTAIGLLPTYAAVGVSAPILLVLLRLLQGMAVGGMWGGSTLMAFEYAPPGRRGIYCAIPQMGIVIGTVTGTLIFIVMNEALSPDAFSSWGWRVPFLLSIIMFPVAFYVHRYIDETSSFRGVEAENNKDKDRENNKDKDRDKKRSSVLQVLQRPKMMLLVTGTYVFPSLLFYLINTGLLDYATRILGLSRNVVLTAILLSLAGWTAGTLSSAWISDRIGRVPVYAAGVVLGGTWSFVIFPLVATRGFGLIVLGAMVGFFAVGMMFGPGVVLFVESFPPTVRYAGSSMGYQLANILGSGLAPLIMAALLAATGTTVSVSLYAVTGAVISLVCLVALGRSQIDRNTAPVGDAAIAVPVAVTDR